MKKAILLLLLTSAICHADTIFLDTSPGIVNGSATYDPNTRACGRGRYRVFTDLDQAASALSDADALYVRAGTYSRALVGKYIEVHGNKVNYWTGALAINASGTPQRRKLVSAYRDELVIIQARPGASNFNPDPADTTFKNSSHYYPCPAISIGGAYMDVAGFKTYGQVVISGHDVTVEGCDFGGGGPHMNQGQVVAINSNREGGAYNVVIRNNRVHHSCWGESTQNGAAVMGYNFSAAIENNEFYDNYGADVRLKDCGGQQGRTIVIRNNLFRSTSINPRGNHGLEGIGQDGQIDYILIHNNIFYRKSIGIQWDGPAMKGTFAYNNTFIDCDMDISQWFKNARVNVYNNLHYHSKSGHRYYQFAQHDSSLSNLNSDYNLFFSIVGESSWSNLNRKRGTTLAEWQQYSGKDKNSVWKDPMFVNPNGSRPEDFKREGFQEKIEDVVGSKYGPICGAYVTGDEVVGLLPKKGWQTGRMAKTPEKERQYTWSFEDDRLGTIPKGWKTPGLTALWQVIEDKTASSWKRILALTNHKRESGSARDACWTNALPFLDGELEVRFKAVGGRMEKGGGLAWRVQDKKTYYSARTNYGPRGNNIGLYCMVNWGRVWKVYAENVFLSPDKWYTMRIVHQGTNIKVYLDVKKLLDVIHENSPLSKPGGVGVCTKGDAVTSFDDLRVTLINPKKIVQPQPVQSLRRVHVFISGRVQGVGFRAFTRSNAQRLELTGWVKNLADSRVEAVIEGPSDKVAELLDMLKRGPRWARVDKLELKDEMPKGDFEQFERRY